MKTRRYVNRLAFSAMLIMFCIFLPQDISAHCDSLDGPVVKAAQKALETGNVNYVLIWVQKGDEEAIEKKKHSPDDLDAGRSYVEAYVEYLHYAQRIYEAAQKSEKGHHPESEEGESAHTEHDE